MDHRFDTVLELLEYELNCNDKLMEGLSKLPVGSLHQDHGFGLRTVHRTIAHIADVMQGWGACVGPHIREPKWEAYNASEDIGELGARLARIGQAVLEAARESRARGLLDRDRRLHQVLHLVTHGTHHRGQILSMLTLLGHDHPFEGGDFGGWSNRTG